MDIAEIKSLLEGTLLEQMAKREFAAGAYAVADALLKKLAEPQEEEVPEQPVVP